MTVRLQGSTSGYVELDSPAVGGNNTLVLPGGNGSAGQVLTTNGSGALSWTSDLMLNAGSASAPSLYFSGDTNTGMWSPAADTVAWSTGATERMRITNAGRVDIGGASTPSGVSLTLTGSSTSDTEGIFYARNTNSSDAATVAAFQTAANSTATSNVLVRFLINAGGNSSGQINANGANAVAFGTWSDARLKENIIQLDSQWENIKNLRPVEFDYIESFGGGHQVGFIAQEIQAVYPDAVGIGSDEMLTVTAWSRTEARLVKVLQEAMERIETLEAKVAALEAQ
jgi:hypothetical protein